MIEAPLISVVVTTYNRSTYLEEAIVSIANQSYKNIEILIIDDGSDVNYAEEITKKFENCLYFYKTNGGLSSARNYGIKKAKGEFIAFLDDDDLWRKDKLEKQIKILEEHKNIDLVHSTAEVIHKDGTKTGKFIGVPKENEADRTGYVFWKALGKWGVKSPTPLFRKSVFKEDLLFDETIMVGEDVDFYNRFFYRHKIHLINEALAYYRHYDDDERLSLQYKRYFGLEFKTLANLKKMGLKNPIIFYIVSFKLLESSRHFIEKFNDKKNEIRLSYIDRIFFPKKSLKKIYNHYNANKMI